VNPVKRLRAPTLFDIERSTMISAWFSLVLVAPILFLGGLVLLPDAKATWQVLVCMLMLALPAVWLIAGLLLFRSQSPHLAPKYQRKALQTTLRLADK
jgi:hypothetical protein